QDNKDGPELLSSINPTFTWVRLAQRIPVRIHITHVPPGVLVSAGMTCTVVIKEARGASSRNRPQESHDGDFWNTFELASRLRGCGPGPTGCPPLPRVIKERRSFSAAYLGRDRTKSRATRSPRRFRTSQRIPDNFLANLRA